MRDQNGLGLPEHHMRVVLLIHEYLAQGLQYRRDLAQKLCDRFEISRATAYRLVAAALSALGKEPPPTPRNGTSRMGIGRGRKWTPEQCARHAVRMRKFYEENPEKKRKFTFGRGA
jgi:hypothetical protein